MKARTQKLKEAGQSLWLDNIQRRELHDGTLKRMIVEDGVCGITSNPTIFMNAVTKSRDYDEQIKHLTKESKGAEEIYHRITIDDIRDAGNLFRPVFEETNGQDGFISIELNPQHAFNIEQSIKEAREMLSEIGLPNIMIKVPGTSQGISVLKQLILYGMNVNVTLLFSSDRYKQVALAYIEALEQRARQGEEISGIHSVASFFISRIDTMVDRYIDEIAGSNEDMRQKALSLRGLAAINVAKVTYTLSRQLYSSSRFKNLQDRGARIQRLLWASTGTKDPSYSDVKYVEGLIAPDTVNTLPPKTIDAFRDHGLAELKIEQGLEQAPEVLKQINRLGIDLTGIYARLQDEGIKAFETSYLELLKAIEEKGRALKMPAAE
jgi:transaldolase